MGASAGVFGLIGAMIALGMREKSRYGSAMQSQYLMWAALNFVIGIFGGFAIDNAAHLGGIAGGFAVAYVAGTPRYSGHIGTGMESCDDRERGGYGCCFRPVVPVAAGEYGCDRGMIKLDGKMNRMKKALVLCVHLSPWLYRTTTLVSPALPVAS